MDQAEIESSILATYRSSACRYRRDDVLHVTGEDHQRLCHLLRILSSSFGRPIKALDVGCGTGRYFHCLRGTRSLVGLDLCEEMLEQARHPVKEDEVSVEDIELVRGSLYNQVFPAESFDLIYSIGVFGNGCGLGGDLFSRFYTWLAPGGHIFFDVIDSSGLPRALKWRVWLRKLFSNICPDWLSRFVGKGQTEPVPLHTYSRDGIITLLESHGFFVVAVYPQECQMPLGPGKKLQCLGVKPLKRESESGRA